MWEVARTELILTAHERGDKQFVIAALEQYDEAVLIRVDPARPEPLYEQLASGIRASIVDGRIAYGERLPSARALGDSLDLNLHTVLRAYRMLRDEGMIELHPGRGAVVAVRLGHHTALAGAIHDLVDEARLNGIGESALLALVKAAYR